MRNHFLAINATITRSSVSPKNCTIPWSRLGRNLAISFWLCSLLSEGWPTIKYNANETRPVAKKRIPIRTAIAVTLDATIPLLCFILFDRLLNTEAIHPQFIAICRPVKSIVKFKVWLWTERHALSLTVFNPRPGRATWEIIKPETNSVITSMNKIVLRKKFNRVRLLAVLKNFFVEFWIHGQAIRRCTIIGIKKINPNTSCNGNPVNLGERSKIKMIRRAVSRQIINLFRGGAIIPFWFKTARH